MEEKGFDIKKLFLGIIIGTLLIGSIIYSSNKSSKKNEKIANPETTGESANPPTAPILFTAAADVKWTTISNKIYTISYPETLALGKFDDATNSIGIIWGNIDPRNNILIDVQSIKDRSPQYVGQTEEYVKNWWKFFSGLKGVLSATKFTNTNGLTGFRAIYINQAGQAPNVDVFFQIPNDRVIHLANGILDPAIFDRIVDSVKYISPSAPTAAPTTAE